MSTFQTGTDLRWFLQQARPKLWPRGGQPLFLPSVGRGATQTRRHGAGHVKTTGAKVLVEGRGVQVSALPKRRRLVEVDADHWKSWVHARLATLRERPGALTLYRGGAQDHLTLAKHLTAEAKVEEFVAGKGMVERWERLRKANHWFDALYLASAAGWLVGVRSEGEEKPVPRRPMMRVGEELGRGPSEFEAEVRGASESLTSSVRRPESKAPHDRQVRKMARPDAFSAGGLFVTETRKAA